MHKNSERGSKGFSLIYAPWRHEYFDKPTPRGCFICRAVQDKSSNDPKNLLLFRGDRAVIVLNRYPYTAGALMIAPVEHLATLREIRDEALLEIMHLINRGMDVLDCALGPEGYNIGINQGKEAGAGLDAHLHVHVVPRWSADTNFMTSIGGARVLAESLDSMFSRLGRALKRVEEPKPNGLRKKRG